MLSKNTIEKMAEKYAAERNVQERLCSYAATLNFPEDFNLVALATLISDAMQTAYKAGMKDAALFASHGD